VIASVAKAAFMGTTFAKAAVAGYSHRRDVHRCGCDMTA
jgi:hypothetical protein